MSASERRDGRFALHAHERGPWLLRVGERSFAIPSELGRQLRPLRGIVPSRRALAARLPGRTPGQVEALHDLISGREAHGDPARAAARDRGRLRPSLTLLPARRVRAVAGRLARFSSWPWLLGATLGGVLGYAVGLGLRSASLAPPSGASGLAAAVLVVLAAALVHELGHAAAMADAGYPPGRIGAGLLLVLPVLFCDVSAAALLPRAARLRVDAAGAAWQLAAGGATALAAAAAGRLVPSSAAADALGAAALGILAAAVWSLLPLPRSDGCWLACDALDVPDLETPLGARGAGRRRAWLQGLRLLHVLFYAALAATAAVQLGRLGSRLAAWPQPARAAGAVGLATLGLAAAGAALRRILRLLGALRADAGRL